MNMNSYKCCDETTLEGHQILSQLSLLKLLADQNRLKILCLLGSNTHTVGDIVEHLAASQSLVSHHLILLKQLSLVSFEKEGREVKYSLTKKGDSVLKLLKLLGKNK